MLFVVGKGGVGRTTIAALLAHRAHQRKQRTLYVSLGQQDLDAARALLPAGVTAIAIEGEASLSTYLRHALPSRWLHRRIVRHELYRRFVAVAPGLRELMALGQVCHEERSGAWDAIIVDAPPTGHALEYLAMPASALATFGGGLIIWEASRMLRELRDPARCRVCPVAIPEELSINEVEMVRANAARLGLHLGSIFVNRVRTSPLSPERFRREEVDPVLECARIESSWAALHRERIAMLRGSYDDVVEVPNLASRSFGRAELEALARVVSC